MKIKQKIMLTTLALVVSAMVVNVLVLKSISASQTTLALKANEKKHLVSIRKGKQQQIEDYFGIVRSQISLLSKSTMTERALNNFSDAFKSYSYETLPTINQADIRPSLERFYREQFSKKYHAENQGETLDISTIIPKGNSNTDALQYQYISNSPAKIGNKNSIDLIKGDTSQYGKWHAIYHKFFNDYVRNFGYYDIFLVDIDSGNIIYSVFKEIDFATSLINGPYANSSLGKTFKKVKNSSEEAIVITDFSPYLPSYEQPAGFIGTPIHINGEVRGVLIFQMPLDRINNIMTTNEQWEHAGLGKTGEVFLVGQDRLLRSESRLLIEDKKKLLSKLEQIGVNENVIKKINKQNTLRGNFTMNTQGVTDSFTGEADIAYYKNFIDQPVIGTYSKLNIPGLDWSIITEITEQEAYEKADDLVIKLILYGIGVLFIMTLLSAVLVYRFALKTSNPIIEMSLFISRTAKSLNLTERLNTERKDEIGDASRALNYLLDTFQKGMHDVAESVHQVAAASEETSVTTEQATRSIRQQQEGTRDVTNSIATLTEEVEVIIASTEESTSASNHAKDHVDKGSKAMGRTIEIIGGLENVISDNCE
ncbi:MAG TPA: hypothetical protein DCR13_05680, partial [Gammaproteobacteria bacterium]|nr:hypothetical protein [Gammaproteobacteria bacterium]